MGTDIHCSIPPQTRHLPRADTIPPEQTPPLEQTPRGPDPKTPQTRHPLRGDTTPQSRHHPQSRHPQDQIPLPRKHTPAYGQRAASTHPTGMHSCSHSVFGQFLPSKRIVRPSSQERYGYRRNLKNMHEDHNYLSNYQMILIMAFCPPSSIVTHFLAVPDSYSSRSRTSTDTIGAVANA